MGYIMRKIKTLFFLTIVIILLTSFLCKISSKAEEIDETTYYKYFQNYIVEEGDTLWNIALVYSNNSDYKSYIKEVISINHLLSDDIKAGDSLVIPYYLTYLK